MLSARVKQHEEEVSSRQPLVLVVDDDEGVRASLLSVLQDENVQTLVAESGEEAIALVKEHQPDAVFLDIWMPGLDGIETLERIKESVPETEVIMISGHATISNALEAMKRGALDLIEKPCDIESIVLALSTALERRARTERNTQGKSTGNKARGGLSAIRRRLPLLPHNGVNSKALAGRNLGQRTLRDSIVLYGQCLHSGIKSGLVLEPLPPNSGIHYAPMGGSKTVPVFVDYVDSTNLATTVRSGAVAASTIEHLMSALCAYGISNLLIKCNGEVPIFDGSAQQFCQAIESIGIEEQGGEWYEIALDEPVEVSTSHNGRTETIRLEPADQFSVRYELNYPEPVGHQDFEYTLDGVESFKSTIAPCRTFGFMQDFERLQKAGLAMGGRLDNVILIGPDSVLNTTLRFPDELVRHKVLDCIGDLFLIGRPLRCRVIAKMTGHSDNAKVLKQVAQRMALSK